MSVVPESTMVLSVLNWSHIENRLLLAFLSLIVYIQPTKLCSCTYLFAGYVEFSISNRDVSQQDIEESLLHYLSVVYLLIRLVVRGVDPTQCLCQ